MNNSILDNEYFLKYGLNRDPFPPGVIDENIFLTPAINRRLQQIKRDIIDSQKLLLIASAPGAGKSLLARKLVILKEPNWRISLINVDADMKADTFSYSVIQQLLPEENINVSQSISMLHKHLEQSYRERILPVVLIDDADNLSFETLQFVLQLADLRYNDSLFRIVLFANESINENLVKVGLKELCEGVVDVYSMPCFNREQIRAYLNFRFSSCGKEIELPYTDEDIEYLHKASAGLPGGINILARHMMQRANKNENTGGRLGNMTVVYILLLLSLSAYLYNENRNLKNIQAPFVADTRSGPAVSPDKGSVLFMDKDPGLMKKPGTSEQEQISNLDESLSLKLSDVLIINAIDQVGSP